MWQVKSTTLLIVIFDQPRTHTRRVRSFRFYTPKCPHLCSGVRAVRLKKKKKKATLCSFFPHVFFNLSFLLVYFPKNRDGEEKKNTCFHHSFTHIFVRPCKGGQHVEEKNEIASKEKRSVRESELRKYLCERSRTILEAED